MKPHLLFWFYKEFPLCARRLKELRDLNPDVPIYGLYGGPLAQAESARQQLEKLLDDFYVFPQERDAVWKWKYGDQLITSWYLERGRKLEWETIFIVQWDMLLLAPLEQLFAGLEPGQLLLSGLRPLSEVEAWWDWVKTRDEQKQRDFAGFQQWLTDDFGYVGALWACQFIVACLPREFVARYAAEVEPNVGFLEYKIPTMARAFGIPFCHNHAFVTLWRDDPDHHLPFDQYALNASVREIPRSQVLRELAVPTGNRLFHPCFQTIPVWLRSPARAALAAPFLRIQEKGLSLLRRGRRMLGLNRQAKSPGRFAA